MQFLANNNSSNRESKVKIYKRITGFLLLTIIVLVMVQPKPAEADIAAGNSFAGMKYTIYLYNTDETSATMSFEANLSMLIDVYDGFGLYLPLGPTFVGLYWAPNYKKTNDLFLLMNGMMISDFIWGWGFAFPKYQFTSIFFFSGYAATQ